MNVDRHEKLRLKQEQRNQERDVALQEKQQSQSKRKRFVYFSVGGALLLVLLIVGVAFALPGKYDAFAQCLHDHNAIMYGAIEWCHFTQEQAGMFGKSFKYLDYRDYRDSPEPIKKTPTWVIDGEMYEDVQSLERLSALTGCSL
jgi:lipopolysaccharide/colanic/teichoic acid biosynthesis glycosyltransferase